MNLNSLNFLIFQLIVDSPGSFLNVQNCQVKTNACKALSKNAMRYEGVPVM